MRRAPAHDDSRQTDVRIVNYELLKLWEPGPWTGGIYRLTEGLDGSESAIANITRSSRSSG